MLAALRDVEHANDLNVRTGPHTARAQDAGGHVVLDERIAGPGVAHAQRQGGTPRRRHVVAPDEPLELVARAVLGDVLDGVALEEHPEHAAAALHCRHRLGGDRHPVGSRRGARRDELRLSRDRHQADPAVSDDGEPGVPAEGRDVDAECAGGLQNGGPLGDRHLASIYRQRRHLGRSRVLDCIHHI